MAYKDKKKEAAFRKKWNEENRDKMVAYRKEYFVRNANRIRQAYLLRRFGITEEQYEELLNKQDGRCAVCLRHQSDFSRRMAVDHNHKTGEIRGLLCNFCNHRVVGKHNDSELLRRAADYLERTTGWRVPQRKRRKRRRRRAG